MSKINHFGWLGYDAERRAFAEAREHEDGLILESGSGLGFGAFRYREFSEIINELHELQQRFKNRPFTWDLERKLHITGRLPYKLIPTHTQDTGNCVAAALAGAGMKLQVIEIAYSGEEEKFREWYVPWIYAISRNQIGNGMSGAGSTGAWGARAVNEYGVLFSDDEGVPGYRGTSDRWGHRQNSRSLKSAVYGKFKDTASDNPVEIIRATSVDQMTGLMDAGMLLTIASYQGFRVTEYKGLHIYRPSGRWSHQMYYTDLRRDPELMLYRMNQWGPRHTKPLNDETPGGAWNLASDIDRELSRGGCEVYGYKRFQGEPGGPDYNFI